MLCPQMVIWLRVRRLMKRILMKINLINWFKNFLQYSEQVYFHVILPEFIISHVEYQLPSQRHRHMHHVSIDTLPHGFQTFGRKLPSSPSRCTNHWNFVDYMGSSAFLISPITSNLQSLLKNPHRRKHSNFSSIKISSWNFYYINVCTAHVSF